MKRTLFVLLITLGISRSSEAAFLAGVVSAERLDVQTCRNLAALFSCGPLAMVAMRCHEDWAMN